VKVALPELQEVSLRIVVEDVAAVDVRPEFVFVAGAAVGDDRAVRVARPGRRGVAIRPTVLGTPMLVRPVNGGGVTVGSMVTLSALPVSYCGVQPENAGTSAGLGKLCASAGAASVPLDRTISADDRKRRRFISGTP
jgi:hypothetical protein